MSQELLEIIECSIYDDKHIVEEPFSLSCGHSACKNCLGDSNFDVIVCRKCNELNSFNFKKGKSSLGTNYLIDTHLEELFKLTEERFKRAIEELKDARNQFEELLSIKTELVRQEIEIRIESLKEELDKIYDEFNSQLNECKDFILKSKANAFNLAVDNTKKYEETFLKLKNAIETDDSKSKESLYKYQHELKEINKNIYSINEVSFQLDFKASNLLLTSYLIGNIEFTSDIKKKLELASNILSFKEKILLEKFMDRENNKKWRLIYRASSDGFSSYSFHQKCDSYSRILVLFKSTNGNIFGGFTSKSWSSSTNAQAGFSFNSPFGVNRNNYTPFWPNSFKNDDFAFLFSLKNGLNKPALFSVMYPAHAICYSASIGPCFGNDILICDNPNVNLCSSNLLTHYRLVDSFEIEEPNSFLAGSPDFNLSEIEVFTSN